MNGLAGSMKFPQASKEQKAHTPLLAADTRHVSRKLVAKSSRDKEIVSKCLFQDIIHSMELISPRRPFKSPLSLECANTPIASSSKLHQFIAGLIRFATPFEIQARAYFIRRRSEREEEGEDGEVWLRTRPGEYRACQMERKGCRIIQRNEAKSFLRDVAGIIFSSWLRENCLLSSSRGKNLAPTGKMTAPVNREIHGMERIPAWLDEFRGRSSIRSRISVSSKLGLRSPPEIQDSSCRHRFPRENIPISHYSKPSKSRFHQGLHFAPPFNTDHRPVAHVDYHVVHLLALPAFPVL
ncbi:hypothetical protein DBV15_02372 [Temnothorax longispinosus]|uniref:Uncharacterized protein n=1 Tax=Temnothorax longispinosus TaxID=300112 RepID=A0A4S2JU43_9HYME|nr:hypothetical protein DBV15_02372 [Temnothorax longispinosus]